MKKVGNVALILNEKLALIRSLEPLILGSEVTVYTEIPLNDEQKSKAAVNSIIIPKGKLKILMLQETNTYIATTVPKLSSSTSPENDSLARSLSLYQSIFGKPAANVSVTQDEPASYSAVLDKSQSINISFNNLVISGDTVGFQQTQPKS